MDISNDMYRDTYIAILFFFICFYILILNHIHPQSRNRHRNRQSSRHRHRDRTGQIFLWETNIERPRPSKSHRQKVKNPKTHENRDGHSNSVTLRKNGSQEVHIKGLEWCDWLSNILLCTRPPRCLIVESFWHFVKRFRLHFSPSVSKSHSIKLYAFSLH